jgi:uncharacterized protein YlxP (DUF503 family)
MNISFMKVTLRASWVHSLKEKRMILRSVTQKLKNKFNISVCEVGEQDVHKIIVIGIAGICASATQSDSMMENILSFIEFSTDAELIDIQKEDIRIN